MRDFDVKRRERVEKDRSFTIGGELFVMKASVRPEVLAVWDHLSDDAGPEPIMEAINEIVLGMIENHDGSHERWGALRSREEDALNLEDLQDLVGWLIEEQTGQTPTQPASPSTSGRGKTTTPSTPVSS